MEKNSQRGGKGQVIIILAVIVVLVLFLLRIETTYLGMHDFSGTDIFNSFYNTRNELKRSGQIAIWSDNYTAAYDFSDFVTSHRDSNVFYSISDFRGTTLNITLANFLGAEVYQVNVSQNLTNEMKTVSLLSDGGSDWVNFTWSPGPETSFEINITYAGSLGTNNHTFMAVAGSGRHATVFHYLSLSSGESVLEDSFSVSGAVI